MMNFLKPCQVTHGHTRPLCLHPMSAHHLTSVFSNDIHVSLLVINFAYFSLKFPINDHKQVGS